MSKEKNYFKLLPVILFVGIIFFIAAKGVVSEKSLYSGTENRVLQKMPKLNKKRVLNGKFQKKYEIYLSDHIPGRDSWIKVQSLAERCLGRNESNGVFFGKDDYLLEHHTENEFDKKQVNKNIKALTKFVEKNKKNADISIMIIPSKTYTMKEYLPRFAQTYDENIFYEKLNASLSDIGEEEVFIDVRDTLEKAMEEEQIYYRTDHHWTTVGAWYAYKMYCDYKGKESFIKKEDLADSLITVSEDFLGTTFSKVNTYSKKDKLQIFEPEHDVEVVYNLGEKTEDTYYNKEFLEKQDKYSVFFGGNQAVLEITGGVKNSETLLVVKDSFANCMLPFLAENYEKVIVVDLRQLNAGVDMLVRGYQPSEVLVLYNTIQFMQSKDIAAKLH